MFGAYIGIDYSGARTPVARNRGLRVCRATRDTDPVRVKSPAGEKRHWTRKEIAHWCLEQLRSVEPVIIGIDHGFSFPLGYMERYTISSWDQFHAGGPAGQDRSGAAAGCFLRKTNAGG